MNIKRFFDADERYHAFQGLNTVGIPMDFKDLLALAGVTKLTDEQFVKMFEKLAAVKEALDDTAFLESQIRGRLAFGVQRKKEEPE